MCYDVLEELIIKDIKERPDRKKEYKTSKTYTIDETLKKKLDSRDKGKKRIYDVGKWLSL